MLGWIYSIRKPVRILSEDRRRKSEDRRRKSEDRRRKTEDQNRKSEDRSRKSEDRRRKSEDRRPRTKIGSRKTEDGRKETEVALNLFHMKFKFEKLIIWQKAMEFGENINSISYGFPKEEMFNLSSQIRRACDSIALNISEGAIGQSNSEFKKFIGYAIRSLAEVVACLHKAYNRKYLSEEAFREHYEYGYNLMNMIVAFKNKIK